MSPKAQVLAKLPRAWSEQDGGAWRVVYRDGTGRLVELARRSTRMGRALVWRDALAALANLPDTAV